MEPVKIGQADANMATDISMQENIKVLLRVNWAPKTQEVVFKPAEDLKRNDKIRVTVEKISEAPVTETAGNK
jgi:hypothetical protein